MKLNGIPINQKCKKCGKIYMVTKFHFCSGRLIAKGTIMKLGKYHVLVRWQWKFGSASWPGGEKHNVIFRYWAVGPIEIRYCYYGYAGR